LLIFFRIAQKLHHGRQLIVSSSKKMVSKNFLFFYFPQVFSCDIFIWGAQLSFAAQRSIYSQSIWLFSPKVGPFIPFLVFSPPFITPILTHWNGDESEAQSITYSHSNPKCWSRFLSGFLSYFPMLSTYVCIHKNKLIPSEEFIT